MRGTGNQKLVASGTDGGSARILATVSFRQGPDYVNWKREPPSRSAFDAWTSAVGLCDVWIDTCELVIMLWNGVPTQVGPCFASLLCVDDSTESSWILCEVTAHLLADVVLRLFQFAQMRLGPPLCPCICGSLQGQIRPIRLLLSVSRFMNLQ